MGTAILKAPVGPARGAWQDRAVILGGLVVVTGLSWAYLLWDARRMERGLGCCAVPDPRAWGPAEVGLLVAMWVVMMVGMMVPSIAPTVLLFAAINRGRRSQRRSYVPTAVFLAGYLAVWAAFSVAASALQWGLHAAALMSPKMVGTSPWLGAGVLVACGAFQLTPWKEACLRHCRSPLTLLMADWREGAGGALAMGWRHGLHCTGCCWLLMCVLFVTGVMNLAWVGIITAFVLLEKVLPARLRARHLAGAALIGWGLWLCVLAGRS